MPYGRQIRNNGHKAREGNALAAIELNSNENTVVSFKLDISGGDQTPIVRLVVPISKEVSMMFHAQVSGASAKINMPATNDMNGFKDKMGGATLEVLVGSSYFTPWSGSLVVKEKPKVQATVSKIDNPTKVKALVDNPGNPGNPGHTQEEFDFDIETIGGDEEKTQSMEDTEVPEVEVPEETDKAGEEDTETGDEFWSGKKSNVERISNTSPSDVVANRNPIHAATDRSIEEEVEEVVKTNEKPKKVTLRKLTGSGGWN